MMHGHKSLKLTSLILIYNIFAITDTLYYTDIHNMFIYCRKWYSGVWVVTVPFAEQVAVYFCVI